MGANHNDDGDSATGNGVMGYDEDDDGNGAMGNEVDDDGNDDDYGDGRWRDG